MNRPRRPVRGLAALGAAALTFGLVPALAATTPATSATAAPAAECPAGTVATKKTAGERAFERDQADPAYDALLAELDRASLEQGAQCRPVREVQVESFAEMQVMQSERNALTAGPLGYTPPGALRTALAAKQAQAAPADVPGAEGTFDVLGDTPLIADDPRFDNVNGLGLADQAGRIDSFTYDDVNDRLFSGPGTGGVWLTTNLGESWTSVGDTLPFQSVGALAWSPEGRPADGTLMVLSGEATAGGNNYNGIGAFYSTDTGKTWQSSTGIPDGLMGFEIEVDPTDPTVVYAATSQGLYRSTDTGRTFANVVLPTGTLETPDGEMIDCAGATGYDNLCQNANWVTDVEVKAPGGVGEDTAGGQVIAAVGYRAGNLEYPGVGTPQSPQNGLYRSDTGEVGSFTYLEDIYAPADDSPEGFAVQDRVGRTELSGATGEGQDHDYLYAIVEDAQLFQGGVPTIDAPETQDVEPVPFNTVFNGVYVSSDFGSSWTRMADEKEVSESPITESALIGTGQAIFFAPGVQAWYNMWIEPDPTMATASGIPTRLVFGLEEVWESRRSGSPQDAREAALGDTFRVIGPYFADDTCAFLDNPLPVCATQQTSSGLLTTHPDQQSGIWIPQDEGGVALVVGNDGGAYVQNLDAGDRLSKNKWGRGNQQGFNTLLPYDAEVAKDGTVAFGLQDNGSGVIEPDGKVVETFGGDGFFAAIDPDDSDVYYNETTFADMRVTTDGGRTYRSIPPPVTNPLFSNPFVMDPTDADHLLTGGPEIVETISGPRTESEEGGPWVEVFDIDEGNDGAPRQMTAVELEGEAAYVGFCSTCDIINKDPEEGQVFESGLATNMGGDELPAKASPAGWHFAEAKGLPDRYISSIAVDPTDRETIYVTLAGYANRQWWPPGSFNDANADEPGADGLGEGHVFKSTDAGDTFTDISGTLPDVPARFVEVNRGQLLVGTDIGVFLSDNTDGDTWAALPGLPNVPVTAIDNHPGREDQVVISTFGRGFYSYTFSPRVAEEPPIAQAREIFDACPPDRVPRDSRQDDDGNVHEFAIDCMVWYEIAKGTSLQDYEPSVPVSRAQMASFIARLIERSGGTLPANAPDAFTDDEGFTPHEQNIDKLAAADVIDGKGDGTYDPRGTVTRAQMAKFIVQAYEFRSDQEIVVPGDYFSDDNGNVHEVNINKSAAAGFTNGANGGYSPNGVVRRDQMASFLARTLDLLVEEGTAQAKQ